MTTPDPAVSAVKRKVVEVSRRSLFVGIHTKFGTLKLGVSEISKPP